MRSPESGETSQCSSGVHNELGDRALYSGQWSPGPGQCHGNVRQCYNTAAGVYNGIDIIFYCFTDNY